MMINEVSKLTGLPNSTIRYYDSLNLLGPIKRGDNNYRFFDHKDIKTLNFINDSKGLGFSLSEIEEILLIKKSGNEPCNFVSDKIKEKISLIEEHIEELLRKKEELLEHLQTGEKVCG